MDENQRLHLNKMIAANNVEDTTQLIRQLKHSHILRENVTNLLLLKNKYPNDPETVNMEGMVTCSFLCTYYTEIYNKIRKDEIDLDILFEAFDVLKEIEDGLIDQHDGAFKFGNLLKKIYIDSALKKADKINSELGDSTNEYKGPELNISWSDYKKQFNVTNKVPKKKTTNKEKTTQNLSIDPNFLKKWCDDFL